MHDDHRGRGDSPGAAPRPAALARRLLRLLRLLTFVDLPIKHKFLLLAVGTLFWFGCMVVVTVFALTAIQYKYHQVAEQILPHEQAAREVLAHLHNLDRDLQLIGHAEPAPDLLAMQSVRDHVKAIRAANAHLSLRQPAATGTLVENLMRSLATAPSAEGLEYLQSILVATDRIDQALDAYFNARRRAPRAVDAEATAAAFDAARTRVADGAALATQHAKRVADAYGRIHNGIYEIIRDSVNAILLVLLIASTLLFFFVRWIIVAFQRPIVAIIRQIDSLSTGDINLAKKVAIRSQDEIGTLSRKFNSLVDSVYGMTVYKKVIEDDAALDDVYHRLGDVFRTELGIAECTIYDVSAAKKSMRVAYPPAGDAPPHCDPEILGDCTQCRAVKTGGKVSSFEFPGVCRRFVPQAGVGHICIPLLAGGQAGGVVQLRFAADAQGATVDPTVPQKLFNAETYINQSLSVIEAKRLMQTLRESAMVDPMTGLYNRRFLQEHMAQVVSGVLRRRTQIGLLVCDIDYFKQVNDTHGHDAGDQLLRETASVLKAAVRESDIVIRFGGEEFLVLLMDVQPGDTLPVAEKIRQAVAGMKVAVGEKVLQKTISIGVAEFPQDTSGFWQAIKYADVALYRAKENGRNQCVRFTGEMWQHGDF